MKKILLIAAMLGFGVAQADYIYWMVGDNATDASTAGQGQVTSSGETFTFDTAKLFVEGNATAIDSVDWETISAFGYNMVDISSYASTASFYVELYLSDTAVAKSAATSSIVRIADRQMQPPSGSYITTISGFQAVPEPTSGLLFLVGGMLLGLRRKRRV